MRDNHRTKATHDVPALAAEERSQPVPLRNSIDDVKVSAIFRSMGRYRPVLAVVAALVLMAVVLPGPRGVVTSPLARPATIPSPGRSPGPADAVVTDGSEEQASTGFDGARSFGAERTPAPPARSAPPSRSTSRRAPTAAPSSGSTPTYTPPTTTAPRPLTIVSEAWATRRAGTPLATTGVPEGSLPVGTRLGQHDTRSFIRLTGDQTVLRLTPVEDEGGHRSPETAVIQACRITEPGWKEAEAASFDEAPAYDAEQCVDGVRQEDGAFTFDLSAHPDRTDARGYAVIPGPDAPIDFQVAFARS